MVEHRERATDVLSDEIESAGVSGLGVVMTSNSDASSRQPIIATNSLSAFSLFPGAQRFAKLRSASLAAL
jgi:hypothetical protein